MRFPFYLSGIFPAMLVTLFGCSGNIWYSDSSSNNTNTTDSSSNPFPERDGSEDSGEESTATDSTNNLAEEDGVIINPFDLEEPEEDHQSRQMLMEPFDLKLELGDSDLRVVDVRLAEEYALGHIPYAVHLDIDKWKQHALSEGGFHDEAFWSDAVEALTIGDSSRVVVYGPPPSAARAWWLLKYLGVQHATILNGGFPGWQEAGNQVTEIMSEAPAEEVSFTPHFQHDRLVEMPDLLELLESGDARVLDARSESEFSGGRIPLSVRIEWIDLLSDDGRYKSPDELRELFAAAGLASDNSVISYCASGGRASVEAFALELAGYKDVKNYFCGWQEWGQAENAPVETE